MTENKNFKSGFVTIIGSPNVGKSTLLNHIVGQKIAIISNKPQTTRNTILAIYSDENRQIVFTDTPGIHKARTKLGEYMVRAAKESVDEMDAILFVIDATRPVTDNDREIAESIKKTGIPAILVLNKIDLMNKDDLLPLIAEFSQSGDFKAIIPISALRSNGIDLLLDELTALMPEGIAFYPEEMVTDQPEKQIAAEIIREKLLWLLDKEVPHGIAIEIEKMKEMDSITEISAVIYCEKASHKGIIIGKTGTLLKKVGEKARIDIEKMLDKKVFLQLWVKVKNDWRNNNYLIKNFGYE